MADKNYEKDLKDMQERLGKSMDDAAKRYGNVVPDWLQQSISELGFGIGGLITLLEEWRAKDFNKLQELIKQHDVAQERLQQFEADVKTKPISPYPYQSAATDQMAINSQRNVLQMDIDRLEKRIDPMMEAMSEEVKMLDEQIQARSQNTNAALPQTKPTQNPESQGNFSIFESEPNSTPVPQPNNDLQFIPSSKPIASQEIDSSEEQTVSQPEPIKEPLKVQQDQPIQIKPSQELNTFEEQSLGFHEQIIDLLTENNTLLTQTNTLLESDSSGTGSSSSSSNDDTATDIMPTSAPLLNVQAFAPTIGQAHDGIDSVPREGTWLLDKGERVLDARTNQDLKSFLANDDDEELVELMAQNNTLLEATHALLEERLTDSFDAPISTISPTALNGIPVSDFEEVDAEAATQQLRDFKAATTEAEQAATDFDDTMNGMQVQMLDLEDICQKTLGNVTQQMRDFGAVATDTGQAVSGLEPAMNGIKEQMQGLEEIFQKTLNGRAIFKSHIGHEKTHLKSYHVALAA